MRSSSLHNSLLTVQTLRFKDFGSEADALTLPYGATEGEGTISLPTAFSNNLDFGSFIRKALAFLHSLPLPNSLPLFLSSTLPHQFKSSDQSHCYQGTTRRSPLHHASSTCSIKDSRP
jgi:hypothetical protein